MGHQYGSNTVIAFGGNNPLDTDGLKFVGDELTPTQSGATIKTFNGLREGNYELFVTVGSNTSKSGAYKVTLTTTPAAASLTVNKSGSGSITSTPAGINCGTNLLDGRAAAVPLAPHARLLSMA
jgi:hypothetical protein